MKAGETPGLVKVRWHRALPAKPVHAIVSRSNGKWYVTLQFKVRDLGIPGEGDTRPDVGIDVGLNSIVATSDGVTVPAPRHLRKAQARTRRLQRALARKRRNSKRRARARRNLARVAAARRDFLHRLSHGLASRHRVIAMADLNMEVLKRSFLARLQAPVGPWSLSTRAAPPGDAADAGRSRTGRRRLAKGCMAATAAVPSSTATSTPPATCCRYVAARDMLRNFRIGLPRWGTLRPAAT